MSATDVRNELWKGSKYLARATDASGAKLGKLAIITYRIALSDHDAGFTLDEYAFRAAIRAAQKNAGDFEESDADDDFSLPSDGVLYSDSVSGGAARGRRSSALVWEREAATVREKR